MDPRLIAEHVSRLDSRYFERFDRGAIARHLEGLASITPARAAVLQVERLPEGELACTVLAFDYPGAFSLITGVLSSLGFDIRSGDIFTWSPARPDAPRSLELRRRRIIDRFTGIVAEGDWSEDWEPSLAARLAEVFDGLERGGEAAIVSRRTVNELAARRLGRIRFAREAVLYPVQIEVDSSPSGRTRMRVISQDTPFFLFTFSTALTLQEVSIEHVTIRTETERIQDEFEFVDAGGRAIVDASRIDRIKLSVLLTKQFTSFLESAPDPLAALLRFEQLTKDVIAMPQQGRWVELLSDQGVLRDLAQLLGASTFLWEDFVRLQYEELLPMLAPARERQGFLRAPRAAARSPRDGPGRGRGHGGVCPSPERVQGPGDLSLRPGPHPHAGIRLSHAEQEAHGACRARGGRRRLPRLARRSAPGSASPARWQACPVRCAIMGLGKLGGVALGYASDIELLFVYSDNGSTAGPERLDNSEFFDKLVREVLQLVHAKREGIFHIDLRLRPYGAAGPLGCSLESFCTYYANGGPAHSYERLSLVRLRAIGGDRSLGSQVERLRDEMVYSAQSIDLVELRALRARQVEEKTKTEPAPRHPPRRCRQPRRRSPSRAARTPSSAPAPLWTSNTRCRSCRSRTAPWRRDCARPASTRRSMPWPPSAWSSMRRRAELVAAYHFFRTPHQRSAHAAGLGTGSLPSGARLR